MLVITSLVILAGLILWLPTLSDGVSLMRLPFRRREKIPNRGEDLPRLLFLVPAHNEEMLITGTLNSLLAQDYPLDRYTLAVIADNCTDRTAAIVRASGVECLERTDAVQRGKPRAIAWALDQLPIGSFDAVVIVDADSVVDPYFARGLAEVGPLPEKAVQCYNDVSNRTENSLTRMAYVFSGVRFRCMNRLKQAVGLNVPLGNGLCLGREVLLRHGWTAFSLSEDWELYAILTHLGVPVEGAPRSHIYSQEAHQLKQSSTQRQRWTAGKMMVLRQQLLPVLRSRRIDVFQKLDTVSELIGLGPAVHLGTAMILAAVALAAAGGLPVAIFVLGSVVRPAVYTLISITQDPQPVRATLAFAYLPVYTGWRLGVQVLSLTMLGSKPWVRTARHSTTA